jgi:hypothetical protein
MVASDELFEINPIEYRPFSHIGLNWTGMPLCSFETMICNIEGAETATR